MQFLSYRYLCGHAASRRNGVPMHRECDVRELFAGDLFLVLKVQSQTDISESESLWTQTQTQTQFIFSLTWSESDRHW